MGDILVIFRPYNFCCEDFLGGKDFWVYKEYKTIWKHVTLPN